MIKETIGKEERPDGEEKVVDTSSDSVTRIGERHRSPIGTTNGGNMGSFKSMRGRGGSP